MFPLRFGDAQNLYRTSQNTFIANLFIIDQRLDQTILRRAFSIGRTVTLNTSFLLLLEINPINNFYISPYNSSDNLTFWTWSSLSLLLLNYRLLSHLFQTNRK